MQRRDFVRRALLTTLGASAAGCGLKREPEAPNVLTSPSIRWRLASSFPSAVDTLWGAATQLAARVSELTEGRFQIQAFQAGELVPALQVFDAVSTGSVEAGHTASHYYGGKNSALGFDTGLPFGLNSRQQIAWLNDAGGRELINEVLADFSIRSFSGGCTGAQAGGWFKRRISSLDDLKGLKFRMPGIGGEVLSRMGASIQVTPSAEIYLALETGAIDGCEFVGPYDDEKLGFYKAAKYYTFPGWHEPGPTSTFYVNESAWQKLPRHYQIAFEVAAAEASADMLSKYDAKNAQALKRLLEKGVTLVHYPEDVLTTARRIAFGYYDELSGQNPAFRKIYSAWKDTRAETGAWLELSELDQKLLS